MLLVLWKNIKKVVYCHMYKGTFVMEIEEVNSNS